MKPLALSAAALAALALAACNDTGDGTEVRSDQGSITTSGEGEDATTVIEGADGAGAVIGAGAAAAVAGPDWARPYPGARVMTSVDAGNGDGATSFETDANPDTVIAYYRERAEEAGLASGANMTMGDMRQYAAQAEGGQSLTVVVQPQGERSVVQVAWESAS